MKKRICILLTVGILLALAACGHAKPEEPEIIEAVHTFLAVPEAGNIFVKWTKNGEDFSTEPQITLLLDESAEYIAVFEWVGMQ